VHVDDIGTKARIAEPPPHPFGGCAADTLSILVMEVVDNAVVLAVPGAMDAGVDGLLFWAALAGSLAVAFVVTLPANRWLMSRGLGHAVVHGLH
jgi:hypothetical protein